MYDKLPLEFGSIVHRQMKINEYYIFSLMNVKFSMFENEVSKLLSAISNPFRIRILLTIGKGEACVCHLEAVMDKRQAFISQHLMALRKAGILDTRRNGKYIYYRLADQNTFSLIRNAGELAGLDYDQISDLADTNFSSKCGCPNCAGGKLNQTPTPTS